jgi:hypothetical protein
MYQFKAETEIQKIREIETAFTALQHKIETIRDFEWGTDVSEEGKSRGYTHCFLVTFSSEKDRDAYLPHPDHQAFVSLVKPHVEKVLVLDFWAG